MGLDAEAAWHTEPVPWGTQLEPAQQAGNPPPHCVPSKLQGAGWQVETPVMSGTQIKPVQHRGWFAPQLAPSLASHAQDAATPSPCATCAGTAFTLTVITCAFAGLPGGMWQMVTF